MFTGLIESVGVVSDVRSLEGNLRLTLRTPLASELEPGESLAVNGVCLTVVSAGAGSVQADIGPETARVTTLGSLRVDQQVNLERAMRADGRIGGHFVQGHVDAAGTVKAIRPDNDAHWLTVAFATDLAAYVIPKGSIAVDGVSLTIAVLRDDEFDAMIIPFTWDHTNLRAVVPGDRVNLECDMIGKYIARAAQLALSTR